MAEWNKIHLDIKYISQEYLRGRSCSDIANELGCAEVTIRQRLKDVNVFGLQYVKFKYKGKEKKYQQNHYIKNKKHKIKLKKERSIKIKRKYNEYKIEHPCIICGEYFPFLLDFHHLNPSEKHIEISNMVSNYYSWERILEEINKCIILCCNCHRKIHRGVIG